MALPSTLVQRVVSGGGPGGARHEGSALGGIDVTFELEFIDPTEDPNLLYSTFAEQPKLLPGRNYQVRILARPARQRDAASVHISGPTTLILCCREVAEISISDGVWQADGEKWDFEKIVELNVAKECPVGEFKLELFYIERKMRRRAATRSFELQGTFYPAQKAMLEACGVVLNATLPENTAILHIEAPQENVYHLKGWSYRERPLTIGPIEQPTLALADFVEQNLEPEHIRNKLRSYSRRNPKALLEWFHHLEKRYGKDLSIIVADHTVSELPWEMLEIASGKYLGAIWKVVRWIPIRAFTLSTDLGVVEREIAGNVLAYLHEEIDTRIERGALDKLTTLYCETIDRFKKSLIQPHSRAALVYLGCHGTFAASDKHGITLGSLRNPSDNLISLEIEAMESDAAVRPLFFVNACHSARLIRDNNGFYGLPEVCLTNLASAYVGTLGPVGSKHAAQIADVLLSEAIEKSVQPAEILRHLREEAIARVTKFEDEEAYLNFVYTFMYVYYGDPLMKIKLDSPAVQEKDV